MSDHQWVWENGLNIAMAIDTYSILIGILKLMKARTLSAEQLHRIVIGKKRVGSIKTMQLVVVGLALDKVVGEIEAITWHDGTPFFQTSSTHLRKV